MRDRGMAPQQEPREDGRESPPVRAAQYVRMSTDHQQYSTENQAETIREYAARHGLLIVRSYADEGKSGLRLEGRDQLQRLIAARRHRSSIDLINAIISLKERGYSSEQIAEKTNLGRSYVSGVVTLMRDGEERLVNAVEKGHIPLAVAIDIARSDDSQVQALLAEAYESGALRGERLNIARKIVNRRKTFGKRFHGAPPRSAELGAGADQGLRGRG